MMQTKVEMVMKIIIVLSFQHSAVGVQLLSFVGGLLSIFSSDLLNPES
jgi:hypothetical protein